MTEEFDTEGTDEVVCPWCGFVHDSSWEWFRDDRTMPETKTVYCDRCGKDILVEIEFTVMYTTRKG